MNKTKINQYTLDGEFIQTFDSCSDAARYIGLKNNSPIVQVCKGYAKTSGGFIWKYSDPSYIPINRNFYSNKRKTATEYNDEFNKYCSDYDILTDYTTCKNKMKFRHISCGNTFETYPNDILSKLRSNKIVCPYCNKKKNYSTEEFKKIVYDKTNGRYELVGNYINNVTPVKIHHKECSSEYYVKPKEFIRGNRCPVCRSSKGEIRIRDILDMYCIPYIRQKKFTKCKNKYMLPFDFYIESINTAIEYDGEEHYMPIDFFGGIDAFNKRKTNDSIKDKFCNDNNIRIIRIKYTDYNNIEKILMENNIINKSVSTIPDECKGVDSEISTESKRKALEIEKI